jgi:hypothetical protein
MFRKDERGFKRIMDLIYTITTKEHFNKYFNLKKGINKEILLNLVKSLYKDKQELQEKFNQDIHLNNISMREIDLKETRVRSILKNKIGFKENGVFYTSISSAESCSFIKHILIYDVLEIKPFFEEDIKNYKELYQEWSLLEDKKKYPLNKKGYGLDMWCLENKHKWIFKID